MYCGCRLASRGNWSVCEETLLAIDCLASMEGSPMEILCATYFSELTQFSSLVLATSTYYVVMNGIAVKLRSRIQEVGSGRRKAWFAYIVIQLSSLLIHMETP